MKIAVSQRLIENETYPETRDALDLAWGRWFDSMGWLPFPVPTALGKPAVWFETLRPDGLLLTGGNDLAQWNSGPLSAMRDSFEKGLVELALQRQLPIVGVCRGAQLLAHLHGARLERVPGHVAVKHTVAIQPEHRLSKALGSTLEVNSYHQIAITMASESLQPLAFAMDGTLEAFTHKQKPLLGIMWHPERETPPRQSDQDLMAAFFEENGHSV